nr:DUF1524 domain-containing protein [Lactobacillus johnsonii]
MRRRKFTKHSNVSLTREIAAEYPTWNKESIVKRTEQLAKN